MSALTFTLKQHTPIIHFQHEQDGATLRASEVKPKLDKYLLEKVFHNDFNRCKQFLVGYISDEPHELRKLKKRFDEGMRAFDYKVKIIASECYSGEIQEISYDDTGEIIRSDDNKIKTKPYASYFANTGKEDESDLKWFRWTENPIRVVITSFNQDLRQLIDDHFTSFIFYENFGTRQSKGFGSFSVLDDEGRPIKPRASLPYFFILEINPNENEINALKEKYNRHYSAFGLGDAEFAYLTRIKKLFEYIDLLYRALRSGINIPNHGVYPCENNSRFYFKSLLFLYAKEVLGYQWEKKTIKETFYNSSNSRDCLPKQKRVNTDPNSPVNFSVSNPNNKKLIRDVLGLSTQQSWRAYGNDTISKKSEEQIDSIPKYNRFKSPISFKPVRLSQSSYKIYLIPNEFPDELKNKWFLIESSKRTRNNPLRQQLPGNFHLGSFLKYVFEETDSNGNYIVNLNSHVSNASHQRQSEFGKLEELFSKIRQNFTHA